uniref:DUF16 domain-containing protein n=1 Tax=Mycoplasmoides pneumoniae TaxID=2104 RepID=UPI00132F8AAF
VKVKYVTQEQFQEYKDYNNQRLIKIENKVDKLVEIVQIHGEQIKAQGETLQLILQTLQKMSDRLDKMEKRIDKLESK